MRSQEDCRRRQYGVEGPFMRPNAMRDTRSHPGRSEALVTVGLTAGSSKPRRGLIARSLTRSSGCHV